MKSKIKIYQAKASISKENFLKSEQEFILKPISYKLPITQTSGNTFSNYGDAYPIETENSITTVGFGVTETNFYYGQPVEVRTTVNSPDGRSATSTAQGTTYTRAETALPLYSPPDVAFPENSFNIEIPITFAIFMYGYGPECYRFGTEGPCPMYRVYYTTVSLPIRTTLDAYELLSETFTGGRFGKGVCDYDATCFGFCSLTQFGVDKVNQQSCPLYTQCRTVVFGNTCLNLVKVCTASVGRGTCSS